MSAGCHRACFALVAWQGVEGKLDVACFNILRNASCLPNWHARDRHKGVQMSQEDIGSSSFSNHCSTSSDLLWWMKSSTLSPMQIGGLSANGSQLKTHFSWSIALNPKSWVKWLLILVCQWCVRGSCQSAQCLVWFPAGALLGSWAVLGRFDNDNFIIRQDSITKGILTGSSLSCSSSGIKNKKYFLRFGMIGAFHFDWRTYGVPTGI